MKNRFPFFETNNEVIYLDTAATAQTVDTAIAAVNTYYLQQHAPVGRSMYGVSIAATEMVETGREVVAKTFSLPASYEVIWTSGSTAALNQLAYGLKNCLQKGDAIVVAQDNHHANLLPWQRLAREMECELVVTPVDNDGRLVTKDWLTSKPKIVALTHVSNVTGTIHPIKELVAQAKELGAIAVIDGAQAVGHTVVDMADLGCDFYVWSAHKLYGPTGVGVIMGQTDLLDALEPLLVGGGMITKVTDQAADFALGTARHEAGSPNTAGIVGTIAALNWWQESRDEVFKVEEDLTAYTLQKLSTLAELTLVGTNELTSRVGVITFNLVGRHPHDIAEIMAEHGVAVRPGHHCAQPLYVACGLTGGVRISLGAYSTKEDIDQAVAAISDAQKRLPKSPAV